MKLVEKYLRDYRYRMATTYINKEDNILDIGTYDGSLFFYLSEKECIGIGIDADVSPDVYVRPGIEIIEGNFPNPELSGKIFDKITALAVVEHIPEDAQLSFFEACHSHLKPEGKLIITVPSPLVDYIIIVLRFFRLLEGIHFEQHYGFRPSKLVPLLDRLGFDCHTHRRFQLGLNNIFVFAKKDIYEATCNQNG